MTTVDRAESQDHFQSELDRQPVKAFDILLPLLLAGYLFFDRTFAYLHIPGTPIFIGEIVLAFGLAGAVRVCTWSPLWRNSNVPLLVVAYAGWGLIVTIPGFIGEDPVVVLRDAAVWIYVLVAVAVLGALAERPDSLPRWLAGYRAIMPVAVVWLTLTTVLETLDVGTLPDSDVRLNSFGSGRAQVQLLMIVAYLWLVWSPKSVADSRKRLIMTGVGLAGILALATKGRGGFLAAVIGIALLLILYPGRTKLIAAVSGVLLVVAIATAVLDPRIDVGERELSASQLTNNVVSILTREGEGGLGGNISWRLRHWEAIWDGVNADVPLTGHGFGPNVAEIYHVPQTDIGLRNAHNTHLTILARSGWIGLGLWIALWAAWFFEVNSTRRRLGLTGHDRLSGLASWSMVGATAMHIEAFFNPSIEGPPSAFWIWTIFAVGVYLVVVTKSRVVQSLGQVGAAADRSASVDIEGLEVALEKI